MLPFKNILIPLYNGLDSSVAIRKALELAGQSGNISIHLVYGNHRPWFYAFMDRLNKKVYSKSIRRQENYEDTIQFVKAEIAEQCKSCTIISEKIHQRDISNALIKYIQTNNIDLFLYCKRETRNLSITGESININKIAAQSSCVVLAVTPNCLNHPIKSILLPVSSFIPKRRIQLAVAFAQQYNGFIHLVTLLDTMDKKSQKGVDIFYETYKILKESGYAPHYKILAKADGHATLVKYAQQVNADLVLLSPQKESFVGRMINKTATDFIQPFSSLHIVMIKPNIAS